MTTWAAAAALVLGIGASAMMLRTIVISRSARSNALAEELVSDHVRSDGRPVAALVMAFWAVSDLNAVELAQFRAALEQ